MVATASAFGTPPPPLSPETLIVEPVPPRGDHWFYTVDIKDVLNGTMTLHDADKKKVIGNHSVGFLPGIALSADHRQTYVATSYFSRGMTGERTDVLEIIDNQTFKKTGEVILPLKRIQAVGQKFTASVSDDGGLLFVTNITPATSVSVVDLNKREVASEVDTAACVLAYPSGKLRFTSLCESGRALTVTLGPDGKEVAREQSEPFIDVENDPVFTYAERWGEGYLFVSFHGMVKAADFSVSPARFEAPWSLLTEQELQEGWRPSGYQPFTVHQGSGRLFVSMQKGGEYSHKDPGTEIWVYDMKSHKRLARWDLGAQKLLPVISLAASKDDKPLLYTTSAVAVQVFDAMTGNVVFSQKKPGRGHLQISPH